MKKYLSIKAGETKILSKSYKILSILENGNPTYSSTCGTLPDPTELLCYELSWAMSYAGNSTQGWDLRNLKMTKIFVGGVTYNISEVSAEDAANLKAFLIAQNVPVLIDLASTETSAGFTDAHATTLHFKSIPEIAESMYVEFSTSGVSLPRIYPVVVDCPTSNT